MRPRKELPDKPAVAQRAARFGLTVRQLEEAETVESFLMYAEDNGAYLADVDGLIAMQMQLEHVRMLLLTWARRGNEQTPEAAL